MHLRLLIQERVSRNTPCSKIFLLVMTKMAMNMLSGISMDVLGITETHWCEKHLSWEKEAKGRFLCGAM